MRLVVIFALMAATCASAAGPRVGRRLERQNANMARNMAGWPGADVQVKPAGHLVHVPAAVNREPVNREPVQQSKAKPVPVAANAQKPEQHKKAAAIANNQPVQPKAQVAPAAGINREPANAVPVSNHAAAIEPEALENEEAALKQALEAFAMDEIEAGFQAIPSVPEAAAAPSPQAASNNAAQQPKAKPATNQANGAESQQAKAQPAVHVQAGVHNENGANVQHAAANGGTQNANAAKAQSAANAAKAQPVANAQHAAANIAAAPAQNHAAPSPAHVAQAVERPVSSACPAYTYVTATASTPTITVTTYYTTTTTTTSSSITITSPPTSSTAYTTSVATSACTGTNAVCPCASGYQCVEISNCEWECLPMSASATAPM